MLNLEEVKVSGYERVAHATDQETGLNAFIAVHNSAVGKATGGQGVSLGGIRMRPYTEPNQLELADEIKQLSGFTEPELFGLQDVVRLSRGMTYKSAIAKTGLGGGKAVVIANPKDYPLGSPQREKLMESMGEAIHEFATRWPESIYVGAEDMNTKLADMKIIAGKTAHISGTGHDQFDGNPSPFTAEGVLAAIKGAVGDDLKGKRVAISGIGSVGGYLADMLHREGAVLTLADIDDKATNKAAELGSNTSVVPSGEIHKQQVDVYV
ncbi:MAG: Glu/Leu/Phe/Val dehydrogenase dimerization domain-containing protein, partial [Alphaproteobacteria bacterium]